MQCTVFLHNAELMSSIIFVYMAKNSLSKAGSADNRLAKTELDSLEYYIPDLVKWNFHNVCFCQILLLSLLWLMFR